MLDQPTFEDFDEALQKCIRAGVAYYAKDANKIHSSQPFGFLWGGDTRLERLLDLIEESLERGTSCIADTTIHYMRSTSLDRMGLMLRCGVALETFCCGVQDEADPRLSLLADSPSLLASTKRRAKQIFEIESKALRRVMIGMPSMPTNTTGNINIINASVISGNVQQGSPGATMNTNPEINLDKLAFWAKIAEPALAQDQSSEDVKQLREELESIRIELARKNPSQTRLRSLTDSIFKISENAASKVITSEIENVLTLLIGLIRN